MDQLEGSVVKYYDNHTPTNVTATNYCRKCNEVFSSNNPCCCDDGCSEDSFWHVDGTCANCCVHDYSHPCKD